MESARVQSEARLLGMRFNAWPLPGLELGLSRLIQYGGGEEPHNASALWSAVKGSKPGGGSASDASARHLAARYGMALGDLSGGVYGEVAGIGSNALLKTSMNT